MKDIIEGFLKFQCDVYLVCVVLFCDFVCSQNLWVLFILCLDSWFVFEFVMQCELGDLFVICNVGNIVLLYGLELGGVLVLVEYVVVVLCVIDVVICGYFDCGVMIVIVICQCMDYMLVVGYWLCYVDLVWVVNEVCMYCSECEWIDLMVCENVVV